MTVQDAAANRIAELAQRYWPKSSPQSRPPFDPQVRPARALIASPRVRMRRSGAARHCTRGTADGRDAVQIVDSIYTEYLVVREGRAARNVLLLESSGYLDALLWPTCDPPTASRAHIVSIAMMVNEKRRQGVDAWECFRGEPQRFAALFDRICDFAARGTSASSQYDGVDDTAVVDFLIHCANAIEEEVVRACVQHLVSLHIWHCLLPGRRAAELQAVPKLAKFWDALERRDARAPEETRKHRHQQATFLVRLLRRFFGVLGTVPAGEAAVDPALVCYCERIVELLIDMETQLPTRRYVNTLLDDAHVVIRCYRSNLVQRPEGRLFVRLLDILKFYAGFEVNDQTGLSLTDKEMIDLHYKRILTLQVRARAREAYVVKPQPWPPYRRCAP